MEIKVQDNIKHITNSFKELTKAEKRKVLFFSVNQISRKMHTKAIRFLSNETGIMQRTIRKRNILTFKSHVAGLTIHAKDKYMDLSHPDFKAKQTSGGVSVKYYRKRVIFDKAFMIDPNPKYESNQDAINAGVKIVVINNPNKKRGVNKLFAFNPANEFIKQHTVEPLQKEFNQELTTRYERKLEQWVNRINAKAKA